MSKFTNRLAIRLTNRLAARSKDVSRALPTAKGGEDRTLQTYRTEVHSYFTEPSGSQQLMYSAENWVRCKLTLETAGPVSIGTSEQIAPVLSGKGRLLDTGVEYEIYLARGTRLYVASTSINRLSFTVEPIPWMEQISGEILDVVRSVSIAAQAISNAIVTALSHVQSGKTIDAPAAQSSPVPTLSRKLAARLTPVVTPRKVR